MFLTPEEISEFTGKVRHKSQMAVLNKMGIMHRARPDGTIAVLRAHVEAEMGGKVDAVKTHEPQPNWGAI